MEKRYIPIRVVDGLGPVQLVNFEYHYPELNEFFFFFYVNNMKAPVGVGGGLEQRALS